MLIAVPRVPGVGSLHPMIILQANNSDVDKSLALELKVKGRLEPSADCSLADNLM